MNTVAQTDDETAALALLKSTKLPLLEAAQVACAAVRAGRGKMKRALRCIAAGEEELKRLERTVTFDKAVEAALEARKHRRARTLCDFRYVTRRFMKRCPGLAKRRVRSITAAECAAYIEAAFETPRQRQKARLTLSGVFSTAMKRGWCSENPVARVEAPRVVEKTVPILTPEEAELLVQAAREYKGGICLPAVGLMLYAGIRPHEVARLTWADVDLAGKRVNIAPQHSKTGGARPVTLLRPALQLLSTTQAPAPQRRICPPQWLHHWRAVRQSAGWNRLTRPWPQDVCRHSYASYHAAHFRNLHDLQLQMGHRSTELLRTRYLNLPSEEEATIYWTSGCRRLRESCA
ncbi:MAG: tyrosine-type recombinase/integrase [Akkermansia sp.]|nr:tyrosine-type recombinase/integrase [Akkermansia sp.]